MRGWFFLVVVGVALGWWLWPSSGGEAEIGQGAPGVVAPAPEGEPSSQEHVSAPSPATPSLEARAENVSVPDRSSPIQRSRDLVSAGKVDAARQLLLEALAEPEQFRTGEICAELGAMLSDDRDEERRQWYSRAVEAGGAEEGAWYRELTRLNDRVVFSNRPFTGAQTYEIQSGDSLWKIRGKLAEQGVRVTVGMIQAVNGIEDPNRIRLGQKLKIPSEALSITVEKRAYRLRLYLGEVILKQYHVGLGKNDKTPEGKFTIASRLKEPTWIFEGRYIPFGHPDHILGTRWLGFENTADAQGFGIHGTVDPQSIGKDRSNGCVRMVNSEVEELFELVPEGTPVEIRL